MYKIAILYICTGNYDIFWETFFDSAKKYLFRNHSVHYFVFTDSARIQPSENITVIFQKKLGWPYDTLLRYEMFLKIIPKLECFDFVYFFNSNLKILEEIDDKEILPLGKEEIVVCKHPGYFASSNLEYPYERNRKSTAYINYSDGKHYFAGGLNGGRKNEYISLVKTLHEMIDIDLNKKIIARWHDESHLNHYCLINELNLKILNPGFLFPEEWDIPFKPKILVMDKNNFGGHDKLRGTKKNIFLKFLSFLR